MLMHEWAIQRQMPVSTEIADHVPWKSIRVEQRKRAGELPQQGFRGYDASDNAFPVLNLACDVPDVQATIIIRLEVLKAHEHARLGRHPCDNRLDLFTRVDVRGLLGLQSTVGRLRSQCPATKGNVGVAEVDALREPPRLVSAAQGRSSYWDWRPQKANARPSSNRRSRWRR